MIKLPPNWMPLLDRKELKETFINLNKFLIEEEHIYSIYPPSKDRFRAFELLQPADVKVVILGQDPYHGPGQAHGLAFSVPRGVKIPPSLINIYKELVDVYGTTMPDSGDLTGWAEQGVLLLNTVLTVRKKSANSHKGQGWETITDAVIHQLSEQYKNIVFVLWGKPAEMKRVLINEDKHLVLTAPHPSPLSSYRGFFGSNPFGLSNEYLQQHGKPPIDWTVVCPQTLFDL
ncbi:MAG: uracil-DNA glycosylase [Lentisphaeria bacterium]|nr:uracil-DNA glycosylase [Lentisphaeria bacterium]